MTKTDIRVSALCGALRRNGGQMGDVEDVVGEFVPDRAQRRSGRIFGVLRTHDAQVRVAFDINRVTRPKLQIAQMQISGKLWLDEQRGSVTLMVRFYRVLDS